MESHGAPGSIDPYSQGFDLASLTGATGPGLGTAYAGMPVVAGQQAARPHDGLHPKHELISPLPADALLFGFSVAAACVMGRVLAPSVKWFASRFRSHETRDGPEGPFLHSGQARGYGPRAR